MFLALLLLLINLSAYRKEKDFLYSYIKAVICWMLVLFAEIELLSLNQGLSVLSVRLIWIIFDVFLLFLLLVNIPKRKCNFPEMQLKRKLTFPIVMCLIAGIVVVLISFYISVSVAPHNWDSLTYHLPRIMHWAQNGTVEHYVTNISRQVSSPVLAEFVNLNVYLMWGKSDLYFNLLQWSSYVTCAIIVGGIARKLKCTFLYSCMAGILFLTMPIAFAESITTQNDLFTAMWLLMFIYVLLDLYDSPKLVFNKFYIERTVVLSLCIAFGYLSKPSAIFAVFIFAIGLLLLTLRSKACVSDTIKLLGVSIAIIGLIILPETLRVIFTFKALSDPMVGNRQLVGTLNPLYIFINMLKNLLFNTPNAYIDTNNLVMSGIYFLAYRLGVKLDDPSISEDGRTFEIIPARTYHHNSAVNPVIFWGTVAVIILAVIFYKRMQLVCIQKMYCVLSVVSFIASCMFIRWEAFVSRYMISYLALLCPVIVLCLNQLCRVESLKAYSYSVIGIIIFVSLIETNLMVEFHMKTVEYAKNNDRGQVYFYICGQGNYGDYVDIAEFIQKQDYHNIGLLMGNDAFEYPLWQYLPKESYQLEHVGVKNETLQYEDISFVPDCIFVRDVEVDSFDYHGIHYVKVNPEDIKGTFLLIPAST